MEVRPWKRRSSQCKIVRIPSFMRPKFNANWWRVAADEAFAAKHMPDLGHEVKEFKVFNWKLTNWKKLEKKITSPEFDCGGHRW